MNTVPGNEFFRKDFHFSPTAFGLEVANSESVRLSMLCRDGHFLANVTMPTVIPLGEVMAFVGEDYLRTSPFKILNTDMTTWQCHFLVSGERVNLESTPQEMAQQLKQSDNYIIVTTNP